MAKRPYKPKLPVARTADLPSIVARYAAGESMQTLAAEYGVARSALYQWTLGGLGDAQHSELVTQALVHRVAEADDDLEGAPSSLDIARAREKARFARMDLERRRPALYGVKQEVKLDVSDDMVDRLSAARARIIDVKPLNTKASAVPCKGQSGGEDEG